MTENPVALLGVGKMGAAFVDRWRAAGRPVVAWNRSPAAAEALAGEGVIAAGSVAEAAGSAPVVVTMLIDGGALRSVLIDQGGLAAMRPGSVLVDLSTVDVASSEAVAEVAAEHGIAFVRGAVSGTAGVVRAGSASLLLSGPADAISRAAGTLDDLTRAHVVLGDGEQARVVKIAINSMVGVSVQMLAEATVLAEASGVSREAFLDALDGSVLASTFLGYKGAQLRARDYAPTFRTVNMRKDLNLATGHGEAVGVPLPLVGEVTDKLTEAISAGYADDDFISLYFVQQRDSGREPDLPGH